ncbi:hypothetical protein BDD43_4354 [Mucilaginibacter gracilis]|uniref:Uncharacterized protein n=1 Tax=Mucilaginibacter gracilis TaxID=423350 RepID=A0A495J597_9SPHI|nr:hypothetical protein [Mucilaginibacter gracilis]RKR84127.1 hypothetical protein BDD43_4354 [Mucilaginibacter gracilis]
MVVKEDPNNTKGADPAQNLERLKLWIEVIKWFITSVVLVIISTIIETGFKDRTAGIQEIQQYDKYVTDLIVLNKEIGPRRLLAQYFANVTASDKLKQGWKDYYKLVDKEYNEYVLKDSLAKIALSKIQKNDSLKIAKSHGSQDGKKLVLPINKDAIKLQQTIADINHQLNANIKLPGNSAVTLVSASLMLRTTSDDKDRDTRLSVKLTYPNHNILAAFNINGQMFEDNSYKTFDFPLSGGINKNEIANGFIDFEITPNGNDTWRFVPTLTLKFSDGSTASYNNYPEKQLDQNSRTLTLAF